MAQAKLHDLLVYLRRICAVRQGHELTDGELLDRFLNDREDAAFTVLVQRHGRMVLGVCQRTTGDDHLAEDAFQATFMVLARRAASIRKKKNLAGWLYAVAQRIATKARVAKATSQYRERRSFDMPRPEPLDEVTWQELRGILDEEIGRLPEKCRLPLILCYFEGKSHDQAAAELGWPRTSLTSRLAQARKLLRRQLTGRGIALSTAAITVALTEKAAAAPVAALLTLNMVKAAASVAAGKTLAATCLSVRAIALTEEAMKGTIGIAGKLTALVLTAGVIVAGIGLAGQSGTEDKPQPTAPKEATPPQIKIEKVAQKEAGVDAYGDPLPPGAIARLGTLRLKHDPEKRALLTDAAFSPDGKIIASVAGEPSGSMRLWDAVTGKELPGPWNQENCTAVAFSPDAAILATANHPGKITLWSVVQAKQLRTCDVGDDHVGALAFKADGQTLISAGQGTVRSFNVATGKEESSAKPLAEDMLETKTGKKAKTFLNCTLSPDGKYLALRVVMDEPNVLRTQIAGQSLARMIQSSEIEVVVLDLTGAKEPWRVKRPSKEVPLHVAFSADGKRIAIAMARGKVEIRDTFTGKLVAVPPLNSNAPNLNRADWMGALALSPDGGTVAIGGQDSNVTLWSPDNPTLLRKLVGRMALLSSESTQCLVYSPDGKTLLVGADSDIQLYDSATLKEITPWDGHRSWIHYVSFSPNGKQLITGSAQINFQPQEVIRWDTTTWKAMHTTSHRTPHLPNIGVSSPEHTWYTGKDGVQRLSLFDMVNGGQLGRLPVPDGQNAAARGFFSPGSKFYVLAGMSDKKQPVERVFAVPGGKLQCTLPQFVNYREGMRPIAFSPNDKLVALFVRGDGRIHVYEVASGKLLHRLGQTFGATADFHANLTFSADNKLLASWNSLDNTVRIWDVTTGKQRILLPDADVNNRAYFAWSPDGRTLAISDKKIQVWELATLKVRREFSGHRIAIFGLAFSPDGRMLASCGVDSTVLVWDASKADPAKSSPTTNLDIPWQILAGSDAGKAFAAICDLAAAPTEAVALIKKHVKPAPHATMKQIEELIAKLDSQEFKVREAATKQLLDIGAEAVPAINKALAGKPALESRLRLESLVGRLAALSLQNDNLQAFRAVEVLERIDTPQAVEVLKALADGAPGATLTSQAQGALLRMKK